jgi:peptidoglycan/xylan/chitin deacetylase (PgdA/CDA1 family)
VSAVRKVVVRALGVPVAIVAGWLLRLSSRKVGVAVLYHGVGDPQGDHERELVAPYGSRLFEQQIRHLERRYRVVAAADLLRAVQTRRRGRRFPAVITFDDDLACHVAVSLPLLRRVGVPATFFLSGASLTEPFAFWWERLQTAVDRGVADVPSLSQGRNAASGAEETIRDLAARIETMTPAERDVVAGELAARLGPDPEESGLRAEGVRALVDGGMEVGFHTRRHDALPCLDDDDLAAAMRRGRDELEAVVGESLAVIAYPHGRASTRVAEAARAAGFTVGFTAAGEPVRNTSHPLLLPRVMPYYRSAGQFALQLVLLLRSRLESPYP